MDSNYIFRALFYNLYLKPDGKHAVRADASGGKAAVERRNSGSGPAAEPETPWDPPLTGCVAFPDCW